MTGDTNTGARFADILTTAAAVADYMGVPDVAPGHVLTALEILTEDRKLEEMGRPVSPMLRRHGEEKGVEPALREVIQTWFARLSGDVNAVVSGELLIKFRNEVQSLPGEAGE